MCVGVSSLLHMPVSFYKVLARIGIYFLIQTHVILFCYSSTPQCVYRCVLSFPYIILVLQGINKVRVIYFLI